VSAPHKCEEAALPPSGFWRSHIHRILTLPALPLPLPPPPCRPGYPSGDGNCEAPTCDCGTVPCGFYFFNHSSTTVVNGQTFGQWFKDSYIFDGQGVSPLVSGFYFDGE
jgi:hypothetical protein